MNQVFFSCVTAGTGDAYALLYPPDCGHHRDAVTNLLENAQSAGQVRRAFRKIKKQYGEFSPQRFKTMREALAAVKQFTEFVGLPDNVGGITELSERIE